MTGSARGGTSHASHASQASHASSASGSSYASASSAGSRSYTGSREMVLPPPAQRPQRHKGLDKRYGVVVYAEDGIELVGECVGEGWGRIAFGCASPPSALSASVRIGVLQSADFILLSLLLLSSWIFADNDTVHCEGWVPALRERQLSNEVLGIEGVKQRGQSGKLNILRMD
ncbi:hypothetical protein B0H19DRAFT_1073650 [Mycena capillaripes]|nr:hypothetical protein B0H19DRAFT_1073650 [Mycena capillaripes]